MNRPTGRLLLLCVLLCVWEPANLALSASSDFGELATASLGALIFLLFRVCVAGVGVAAGLAMWNRRFHALPLAKTALSLSAAAAVVRLAWFPGNVPPGLRLPIALLFLAYNAAWYTYLVTLRGEKWTA